MAEEKKFFEMSSKQGLIMGFSWGIALISIIALVVVVGGGLKPGSDKGNALGAAVNANVNANTNTAPTPPADTGDVTKLSSVLASAASTGPANAKVTLIEVSDFQCPYCERHVSTMEQIMKDYAGKVRRIWINFPLTSIHPYAEKAAEAAECAGEQNKFWEMHDKIFANQSAITVDNLKGYAKDLGLNTGTFNNCLDSGETASKIQAQATAAQAAGISGTPGTFVNDQLVKGAYPYDTFKQLIDAELVK